MSNVFWENGYFSTNNFNMLIDKKGCLETSLKLTMLPNYTLYLDFDIKLYREDRINFIENVNKLIKDTNAKNLAINLNNTEWLDSSTIGTLVNLKKTVPGSCCVFNYGEHLLEIFKVLKLDLILNIFKSEYEAFKYLNIQNQKTIKMCSN
ncbi:MAG: STAS domain-containing protein [Cyanobacteriota bacterium]